ncbi:MULTISPECIES: hypothetical protein [unclassified Prochlorococcus]|uniref:hypothetical protein n=1 Tax=unclassified Prochlorococcus TaxID=2627481 RepID=UPI000533A2DB|nr:MULTISPECIES: hypothetical protein [unclassified Prochlorococcus]KGG14968.1 hypothetical protein EV06_1481 [Prochlorococcus sp. MIT 0602]KGG17197.1 hypothetical protein EV07_0632 [Prochlorococcus sp. MIT 0603]
MPENLPTPEPLEAFTIPEGSILLDTNDLIDPRSFAIAGLKKLLIEREIDLALGPELDLDNPNRLISLNRFAVQIVTAGINADEITIPMNHWYRNGAAPQLLLACHVDDENNLVWFSGVLTGPEFKKAISNQIGRKNEITISTNEFQGGIDRLLRFVRILETDAIPRMALNEQAQTQSFLQPIKKTLQSGLSVAVFVAGAVIFGPAIFRPRLIGNIAMLSGDPIEMSAYKTRSSYSGDPIEICLLTPNVITTSVKPVAKISIDRPIVFPLEPLNEIKVYRNGELLWRKGRTSTINLIGPIPWPNEITPIKANEKLLLSITKKGSSLGEEATITLQANSQESFQKLTDLENSLGNKKSKWISTINQQLKNDRNLALTLLFSEKAPKSKALNQARSIVLSKEGCTRTK